MNEGAHVGAARPDGSPGLAEDVIVARDLLIAEDTGKAWHIAHVSTARVARSRCAGRAAAACPRTCEVTPHHLLLHRRPLRRLPRRRQGQSAAAGRARPAALRAAVRDGTIDVFATDHAPHGLDEKAQLLERGTGRVQRPGNRRSARTRAALPDLPLERFIELLCINPARILGVPGGTLGVGSARRRDGLRRPAVDRRRARLPFAGARTRPSTARRSRAGRSRRSSAAASSTNDGRVTPRAAARRAATPSSAEPARRAAARRRHALRRRGARDRRRSRSAKPCSTPA